MAAKVMLLRYVLAAVCPALAAADRTAQLVTVVPHSVSAPAAAEPLPSDGSNSSETAETGSLDYSGLEAWHTEAMSQVDGFNSKLEQKLEPAAAEGVGSAEKYAQMLQGLDTGLGTFRAGVAAFRSANRDAQGRSSEEVRGVLESARTDDAAQEQPEPAPAKAAAPDGDGQLLSGSKEASKEADKEADLAEASKEADKLTSHTALEVKEQDAMEAGSVVRKDTSEEAKAALGDMDKVLSGNGGKGEFSGDVHAAEQAVEKLVLEEEEQQTRVTAACFALADSPLKGEDRRCNSEAVSGMFTEKYCEGRDLKAACDAAPKCQTKHVCLKDGGVVKGSDGSWKVNDAASCDDSSAQASPVCAPKAGGFVLPPP